MTIFSFEMPRLVGALLSRLTFDFACTGQQWVPHPVLGRFTAWRSGARS